MKTKLLTATILVLIITACDNNRTTDNKEQLVPKELQGHGFSYEISSTRGSDDLVDDLYSDVVKKDTLLEKLEVGIKELNRSKSDSTEMFSKFHTKNQSYFNSADRHVLAISDSLLRNKMKYLVAAYLANYNALIRQHKELLTVIDTNQQTVSDLHTVLKLVKTLPVIEKYQRAALPNTKSLEGYIQQQEQVVQLADTLSKR